MNKVAILCDIHFGVKQNSDTFLNNQIKYLFDEFIPYLIDNNIKDVYILGDVFDSQTSINLKVSSMAHKFFDELLSRDINIVVIVGNHDSYLKNSIEYNSLKFLKKFKNVRLIEEITIINSMLFVPWQTNPESFIKELETEKYNGCRVCFGHFEIMGFPMYKGGMLSPSGLPDTLFFSKFKMSVSGHFHSRSIKEKDECVLIYPGTSTELNRNDKGDPKGFMVLDLETLSYDFIAAKNIMKFVDITYPEEPTETLIKNNVVDVFIDYGDKYDQQKLSKYIEKINSFTPALPPQIKIVSKNLINVNDEINNLNISSTKDLIDVFIDENCVDLKEETKKLINELYVEETKTNE